MGDTHPKLIRAEDRERFWRYVDEWKRSGSELPFPEWVQKREDDVAHAHRRDNPLRLAEWRTILDLSEARHRAEEYLRAAARADRHSSDREPLVDMPEDER